MPVADDEPIELSIVLPCFNEEGCVAELTGEIRGVLERLGRRWEILYVDDASTDSTGRILADLAAADPRVRVVTHSVNSGESAAMATGFQRSRGSVVVTMDSDQQNDPADIPAFLAALATSDVVSGIRRRREDDFVKRVSSKLGNGFRNAVTGVRVSDAGCTYRAIRREALREIPVFNGMHRFVPTLATIQGWRVSEIFVNHRPRTTGRSKYGIGNRMFRGIRDCFAMRWWRRRCVPAKRVRDPAPGRP